MPCLKSALPVGILLVAMIWASGCSHAECPEGTYQVRNICRRVDAGIQAATDEEGGATDEDPDAEVGDPASDDRDGRSSGGGSRDAGGEESSRGRDAGRSDDVDAASPSPTIDGGGPDSGPAPSSECGPGQFVASPVVGTAERVCASCASGTFNAQQSATSCTAWKNCEAGSYVANTPSGIEDRACRPCEGGTTSTSANQSMCLAPGSCQAGTNQTTPATGTAAPVCRTCTRGEFCAGGTAQAVPCDAASWDHDSNPVTACAPRITCNAGQYVSNAGSATANRECSACPAGTFSNQANAVRCMESTVCASGYAEVSRPSSTANRSCSRAIVWTSQFGTVDADRVWGLGVDDVGNIVVAGETFGAIGGPAASPGVSDVFVRKYSAAGAVLWTRQFGSVEHELVRALYVDGAGNSYVGGGAACGLGTCTANPTSQAFIRKYNEAGTEQWTRFFGDGAVIAVTAVDGSGNVYVAGQTRTPLPGHSASGDLDCFVRKYNSSGTELWTGQFGTNALDGVTGIAVDSVGNAVVSGVTDGALVGNSLGNRDAFIVRYNATGREAWTRQFGTADLDRAGRVALASDGSVYVAGTTYGNLQTGAALGTSTAYLRKFDIAGAVLWTHQFPSSGGETAGYAVALDASENAFLAGETWIALPGHSIAGNSDILIRKYSSAGVELSTMQYGGVGAAVSVYAINARGTMCVGGEALGSLPGQSSEGAFVLRFEM